MLLAMVPVIVVAIVLLVVLLSKDENNYDERQELIMNRSYKYAFLMILSINTVIMVVSFFDAVLELLTVVLAALSIWGGLIVQAVYAIWQHAYFPFTLKNGVRFGSDMLFLAVIQGALALVEYFSVFGGKLDLAHIAVFSLGAVSVFIIAITIFWRNYLDKREELEK